MELEKNNCFACILTKKWGLLVGVAILMTMVVSHGLVLSPLFRKKEVDYTVKANDTLNKVLKYENIPTETTQALLNQPLVFTELTQLTPGECIHFIFNQQNKLASLTIPLGDSSELTIACDGQNYDTRLLSQDTLTKTITIRGKVEHTIYNSMRASGVNSTITMQFINIFSQDLLLTKNIRTGDSFSVILAATFKDNQLKTTKLLAAELTTDHKTYYAILDHQSYYSLNGSNWSKAFLRSPLRYKYVSSGFNLHRHHPILHIARPHFGVDFAAEPGTPVHASSNGKIVYEGRESGYGNLIILKESHVYSTRYAHLQKFAKGMRVGHYVKEGETIGYVGNTGLATGPHLHYEFRIHNKPVNPLTVALPPAAALPKTDLNIFKSYANEIKALFG